MDSIRCLAILRGKEETRGMEGNEQGEGVNMTNTGWGGGRARDSAGNVVCLHRVVHTPHTQELGSRYVAGNVPCSGLPEDCGGLKARELMGEGAPRR